MEDEREWPAGARVAAHQRATELWSFMQAVEKTRHLAECLEASATRGPAAHRELRRRLAAQLRGIADQLYALACDAEPALLSGCAIERARVA